MKPDISSREHIELLVNTFYEKVQNDDVIAHFFNDVAQVNWEKHLPKMYDFWDSIIRNQHNYHGSPMPKHIALSEKSSMKKEHFERWLQLFNSTLDELFEAITLIQTHKIEKFPVILVGSSFWVGLLDWIKATLLERFETISAKDLDLINVVDTSDEVIEILNNFYTEYQLSPNF